MKRPSFQLLPLSEFLVLAAEKVSGLIEYDGASIAGVHELLPHRPFGVSFRWVRVLLQA